MTPAPREVRDDGLAADIAAEATRLGIHLPPEAAGGLARYATSLWAWNERLNLTRHTDVGRFVSRDVGDAAAIAERLAHGERVLDVGTGGGAPGVILAILRPDLRVELCDSVAKKARAVAAIVAEAGFTIPVHAAAAQELVAKRPAGRDRFDSLVVRAVAPLSKLLGWFEPLAGSFGRLLVIKGPRWEEELAEARGKRLGRQVTIRRIASWPLRGTDNESVLLEIRATG
ncbi:MAG: 16S rRNA (guanine(527)-N(7))-methyltransferase RsmG [Planctomycetota bacterium]